MLAKKVIIRVDGNSSMGLGHIYRGLAIAEMLKDQFDVIFVIRQTTTAIPIEDSGFSFRFIPKNIIINKESEWLKDFFTSEAIIILDGYQFDENYQTKLKNYNFKLIYIDDLALGTQKADFVINHNPGAKEIDYKTEEYTKLALGLNYAMLRPVFLEIAKQKRHIQNIDTAFVCFGGSDTYDYTLRSVKALLKVDQFKKINVVIGEAYAHEDIFELCKTNPIININKNLSETELIAIMQASNFAIAPSSTILLELMAVGMPILSGYYVENQKKFYQHLKDHNLIYGIDNFSDITDEKLRQNIISLLTKPYQDQNIIDGMQKRRFIEIIDTL